MTNLIFIADLMIDQACQTPMKMMHLYMNRLVIEEERANEIIGIEIYSTSPITEPPVSGSDFVIPEPFTSDNALSIELTAQEMVKTRQELYGVKNATSLPMFLIKYKTLVKNAIPLFLRLADESKHRFPMEKEHSIHLIYSGNSFRWIEVMGYDTRNQIGPNKFTEQMTLYVQKVLENLKIHSIQMTFLEMWKQNLVTSETANSCFTGKTKTKSGEIMESVNDDLEKFQSNLASHPQTLNDAKLMYLLPKARL